MTVELDATGARVLDAAVQVLVDFGFECATVDLVVKYAGVSHTAVYRRWPAKNELLGAAVLREFNTIFDAAVRRLDDRGTFEDKVVCAFTAVVWSVRNHPLMTRERETVLSSSIPPADPTMQTALALVTDRLRGWANASGFDLDDPEALADIVVRLAHSVLLVPQPTRPLDTRIDIENYARRHLGPLIQHAAGNARKLVESADLKGRPRSKPRRSAVELVVATALAGLVGAVAIVFTAFYSNSPAVTPTDSAGFLPGPPATTSITPAPVLSSTLPSAPPVATTNTSAPPQNSPERAPSTRSVTTKATPAPTTSIRPSTDNRPGPMFRPGMRPPPLTGPGPVVGPSPMGPGQLSPLRPGRPPSTSIDDGPKPGSPPAHHPAAHP